MNLANKITIFRIFLVPVFMFTLYSNFDNARLIATVIFAFASLTDSLDGYIARSRNLITNFGKFIDPLADKILVSAALISLVDLKMIPAWAVVVIIAREFTITGFRTIAVSEGITIAASPLGKIKTVTQLVAIILLLLDLRFGMVTLYISLFFTVISGVDYIYKNRSALKSE